MVDDTTLYVGLDVSKEKIAVGLAEAGRKGEVRYYGEIANRADTVRKFVDKLAGRHERLCFCYEAGPTGYGLYRQLSGLGHECLVVAPSLIPTRPGLQIKTDRRDAVALAALLRAGNCHPSGFPTRRMRPCAIFAGRGKRRSLICDGHASISCHFCSATAGSSRAGLIGQKHIETGWRPRGSIIGRSRSPWKNIFVPSSK
ncbi:IS110 family transposase [Brucella sp. ZJ1_1]|uniref:Transposase IS116/IS110/IS902 family protein n=1 Tax=Brucella intermedia M86 TaxID=1234597 RepID=M5JTI0_9HYPH|nr:transposase IS116/IS110/IS902 family protein [Brucella intermedia M86]